MTRGRSAARAWPPAGVRASRGWCWKNLTTSRSCLLIGEARAAEQIARNKSAAMKGVPRCMHLNLSFAVAELCSALCARGGSRAGTRFSGRRKRRRLRAVSQADGGAHSVSPTSPAGAGSGQRPLGRGRRDSGNLAPPDLRRARLVSLTLNPILSADISPGASSGVACPSRINGAADPSFPDELCVPRSGLRSGVDRARQPDGAVILGASALMNPARALPQATASVASRFCLAWCAVPHKHRRDDPFVRVSVDPHAIRLVPVKGVLERGPSFSPSSRFRRTASAGLHRSFAVPHVVALKLPTNHDGAQRLLILQDARSPRRACGRGRA